MFINKCQRLGNCFQTKKELHRCINPSSPLEYETFYDVFKETMNCKNNKQSYKYEAFLQVYLKKINEFKYKKQINIDR